MLARIAGTTYADLIRTEITGPLGLDDTVVDLSPQQRQRVAPGHTRRLKPRSVTWTFDALAGAGALWSTAPDLLAFAAAHIDPPETALGEALQMVVRPRVTHHLTTHALAWLIPHRTTRVDGVFHNGGVHGYRSALVIEPGHRRAAVALTATDRNVDGLAMRSVLAMAQESAGEAA